MTGKKRRGEEKGSGQGTDKEARSPEETKIEVPLDIALSLLTPKERAKLRNYVLYGSTFYQASHALKGEAYAILAERHAISIDHIKGSWQKIPRILR